MRSENDNEKADEAHLPNLSVIRSTVDDCIEAIVTNNNNEVVDMNCELSNENEIYSQNSRNELFTHCSNETPTNKNLNQENDELMNIYGEIASFSTDLAYYSNVTLTSVLIKKIISAKSCRPTGPFVRDPLQNNRKFSANFYTFISKYGPVERAWLCYSPKLDAVYCEPCWLFSTEQHNNWHHGVRDWQGLSKKIKLH